MAACLPAPWSPPPLPAGAPWGPWRNMRPAANSSDSASSPWPAVKRRLPGREPRAGREVGRGLRALEGGSFLLVALAGGFLCSWVTNKRGLKHTSSPAARVGTAGRLSQSGACDLKTWTSLLLIPTSGQKQDKVGCRQERLRGLQEKDTARFLPDAQSWKMTRM